MIRENRFERIALRIARATKLGKLQRTEIGAIFAICDCDAHRGPPRFRRQDKAMLHCDLRVRWKVASVLRFRAAISEPKSLFLQDFWRFGSVNAESLAIEVYDFGAQSGET